MPLSFGTIVEVVAPPCMKTFGEVMVTFGLLLISVTKIPPRGAGLPSVIGNGANEPSPIITLAGKMIPLTLVREKKAGVAAPEVAATL